MLPEERTAQGYSHLATSEDESVTSISGSSKWEVLWRVTNGVMAIFFILAGFVQINDPDPYVWIPVYIIPALLSIAIAIRPQVTAATVWRILCVLHIGVCFVGSSYLMVHLAKEMSENFTSFLQYEEGRELAGLVIVIAWLGACRFTSLGSNDPRHGSVNSLLLLTAVIACLPLVFWSLCFINSISQHLGHCKDMFPGMLG